MKECISLMKGITIIGKWEKHAYRILKKIGEDGVGQVYRVYDSVQNKIFILKASTNFSSLTREYMLFKQLSESNNQLKKYVPKVYELDYFVLGQNKIQFFIQEYVFGMNLGEYIRNKEKIQSYQVVKIGSIICNVLKYLDDIGYVYDDLKVDHIIVDMYNERISIVGFGGSVRCGESIERSSQRIFSLGILLYSLLTGEMVSANCKLGKDGLRQLLKRRIHHVAWQNIIWQTWFGDYKTWDDVKQDLMAIYHSNVIPFKKKQQIQGKKEKYVVNQIVYFIGVSSLVFFFLSYIITH